MKLATRMFLVFALGIGAGLLIYRFSAGRPVPLKQAQQRAITILDTPAITHSAKDQRLVVATRLIEPCVVSIDIIRASSEADSDLYLPNFGGEIRGKGSGVIITPDGYIVTNNHVVAGATRIRVTLGDGKWLYGKLVGNDPNSDLAVVKVEGKNLPAAALGDSDSLMVGETTLAIGNPLGLGSTVTSGIISALNRKNLQVGGLHDIEGIIQTDAPINKGNSGGALANAEGQLIGINTAILSVNRDGGSIGLGFALPVNTVRRVVKEIITTGHTSTIPLKTPWMGVQFGPIPDTIRGKMNLPRENGIEVSNVIPNTPAFKAGILKGDILVTIDDKMIAERSDVLEAVQFRRPGDMIVVNVLRPSDGSTHDYKLRLAERPAALERR